MPFSADSNEKHQNNVNPAHAEIPLHSIKQIHVEQMINLYDLIIAN